MTAEAVVLNRSAVAMAADSAMTVSSIVEPTDPNEKPVFRVFETANKLFEMVRGRPVGIMFHSNASINGVPWETIIKAYRDDRRGATFDHLAGYATDFIGFVNDTALLDERSEDQSFTQSSFETAATVKRLLNSNINMFITSSGRVVGTRFRRVLDAVIDTMTTYFSKQELGWPGLSGDRVRHLYGDILQALVDEEFQTLPISNPQKLAIENLIIESLRRRVRRQGESGIVISGFGDAEPFPSYLSLTVQGRFLNGLRIAAMEPLQITLDRPGDFGAFAQQDQALQFATGVHESFRTEVMQHWGEWATIASDRLGQEVRDAHPRLSDATVASVQSIGTRLVQDQMAMFVSDMNEFQTKNFLDPMRESVAWLPKEDLAVFAEGLVNLTRMHQRISITSDRTVGGEIDLALISRGDGFVWLSRKHYFNLDLNPAWPAAHAAKLPSTLER